MSERYSAAFRRNKCAWHSSSDSGAIQTPKTKHQRTSRGGYRAAIHRLSGTGDYKFVDVIDARPRSVLQRVPVM
jgi:hypothetical protein